MMEIRKIIKVGNSVAVTLPPDSLRYLQCKVGDAVQVFQEPDCIRIQPVEVKAALERKQEKAETEEDAE